MDQPTWDGLLLADAAVFAAAVAAWSANRRIDKQLLAAEGERLDKQLAHDRWMRELDELRRLVDDATTCGLAASKVVGAYRDRVRERLHDSPGRLTLSESERRAATGQVAAMQGFVDRLEVRFG
jgi:hypothetical protein